MTESFISTSNGYTREQKMVMAFVFIGDVLCFSVQSLPAPFLPQEDELHGVNGDITGWVLGLSPLIMLLFSPLFGKLLPKIGVHKMVTGGLFVAGGSTALFGLLSYISPSSDGISWTYLVLAFLLRGCQALGSAAFTTASMTLITIAFPENSTTILSYSETMIGLGVMGAPALGSGLYAIGGFTLPFAAVGGLLMACSILMFFVLDSSVGGRDISDGSGPSVLHVLKDIRITTSLILTVWSGMLFAATDPILEPELRDKFGLKPQISALAFLLRSGTYASSASIAGKIVNTRKCVDGLWLILTGCAIAAVSMMFAGPAPFLSPFYRPLWLLLICLGFLGLSLGLIVVPTVDIIFHSDVALESRKGKYNINDYDDDDINASSLDTATAGVPSGLWSSAVSLGEFMSSSLSGMVTEHTNFGFTLMLYAFGCVIMIGLIFVVKLTEKRRTAARQESQPIERPDTNTERTPLLS